VIKKFLDTFITTIDSNINTIMLNGISNPKSGLNLDSNHLKVNELIEVPFLVSANYGQFCYDFVLTGHLNSKRWFKAILVIKKLI